MAYKYSKRRYTQGRRAGRFRRKSTKTRRRPYSMSSRKRTSRRSTRMRSGKSRSMLAAYLDPFVKTNNPRYPDGSMQWSQGTQFQLSSQLTQVAEELLEPNIGRDPLIVLYPGLTAGLAIFDGDDVETKYWNDAVKYSIKEPMAQGNLTANWQADQLPENPVSYWRLVSAGLKLKLVNSTEDNSGWFEATRLRIASTNDFIRFNPDGSINPAKLPYIAQNSAALVQNPGYMTDSLKNIGKYVFNLAPTAAQHEWNDLEKRYNWNQDSSAGVLYDEITRHQHMPASMKRGLIDDSYDIVIIKIHGTTGNNAESATRLQYHAIHNHEYVYELDSIQYKTMTATAYMAYESLRRAGRAKSYALKFAGTNSMNYYRKVMKF